MPADVVEDDRTLLEQGTENAVRPGQLADGCGHPLTDPRGDEAREPAASVWHPDRPVSCGRLPPRGAHDPLEHRVEVRRVAEGEQVEHTGGHRIGVAASTHHAGCYPSCPPLARSRARVRPASS